MDKAKALSSKQEENLKEKELKKDWKFELTEKAKRKDQQIKEKHKSYEKEVEELGAEDTSGQWKKPQQPKTIEKAADVSVDKNLDTKKAVEDAKKAIEMKLYNKKVGGASASGKAIPTITHGKRNPILPPWTPVSKTDGQKTQGSGEKKIVTAEDILKAFTGKSKAAEREKEEAEQKRLIEEAKKNEEMIKQQEAQDVISQAISMGLPFAKKPASADWEKPKTSATTPTTKSVPLMGLSVQASPAIANAPPLPGPRPPTGPPVPLMQVNPVAAIPVPLPPGPGMPFNTSIPPPSIAPPQIPPPAIPTPSIPPISMPLPPGTTPVILPQQFPGMPPPNMNMPPPNMNIPPPNFPPPVTMNIPVPSGQPQNIQVLGSGPRLSDAVRAALYTGSVRPTQTVRPAATPQVKAVQKNNAPTPGVTTRSRNNANNAKSPVKTPQKLPAKKTPQKLLPPKKKGNRSPEIKAIEDESPNPSGKDVKSENKIGELVVLKDDSSSDEDVIVAMDDEPTEKKAATKEPELVSVSVDIESGEWFSLFNSIHGKNCK